jgi:hypothetical protein
MANKRSMLGSVWLVVCALSVGCNSDDATREIEIAGTWMSSFGDTEVIDSERWGSATIVEYDNRKNFAITQNPEDDDWNPSKYNKIVWTDVEDGSFYYCWVDFALDTAEEARNTTETADASDPESGGCGGFSWTRLKAL